MFLIVNILWNVLRVPRIHIHISFSSSHSSISRTPNKLILRSLRMRSAPTMSRMPSSRRMRRASMNAFPVWRKLWIGTIKLSRYHLRPEIPHEHAKRIRTLLSRFFLHTDGPRHGIRLRVQPHISIPTTTK